MSAEVKSLSEIFSSMSENCDAIAITINNMSQNQNCFDSDSLIKLSQYFENLKNDCNDAVINQNHLSKILNDYVNETKEIQFNELKRLNDLKNQTNNPIEYKPMNFREKIKDYISFK